MRARNETKDRRTEIKSRFSILEKTIHHRLLRKEFYSRIISDFFSDCSFILDIGCGQGDFLMVARGQDKEAVGVDLSKVALDQCKTMRLDVIGCDIVLLPFKDHSVDGIFFSHVIEHVSDVLPVLTEFRRVLKNKLVVITPTEHRSFWNEKGHLTSYTKNELKSVLRQAGYRILKVSYDKSFMFKIQDREFLVKMFNLLPFIWFKMNIIAIAATELA